MAATIFDRLAAQETERIQQSSNPPATLPASFNKSAGPPDTLPADFFQKQQAGASGDVEKFMSIASQGNAERIFGHMARNGGIPPTSDEVARFSAIASGQQDQFHEERQPKETGVMASVKRNTIGAIEGLYHAFTQPATEQEKARLLEKVREENQRGNAIPETLATNPSSTTLALHRLIDAPAQELSEKADKEEKTAMELLQHAKYWKGGNLYLSSLADRGLSAVPVLGPGLNAVAERME